MLKCLAYSFLVILTFFTFEICSQVTPAPECPTHNTHCQLPSCRCFSANGIPGEINRDDVPQIVYLTFDDNINVLEFQAYEEILFNRTNPNGARISATFFISHEYNDYQKTHELYRRGHEIALHSITHKTDQYYWYQLNEHGWVKEFAGQRIIVSTHANIPQDAIKGMRPPFRESSDEMYSAISKHGFEWESSRGTWTFRPQLWPYTNDFKSIQDCRIGRCPVGRYPGFWTMPIVSLLGGNLFPCDYIDSCLPTVNTTEETFNLLKSNFEDHYTGNKAPFGINTHAHWLDWPDGGKKQGFIQFLDYLQTKPDVFIVSISQALDWIKNPVPLANISKIESWNSSPILPNGCPTPVTCRFITPGIENRYIRTCRPCESFSHYPWLDNPEGN